MSKKISIKNPYELPQEVDNMTIGELVRSYDAEVYLKAGKATVKKRTSVCNLILQFDFFQEEQHSSEKIAIVTEKSETVQKKLGIRGRKAKQNYWEEIQMMLDEDMSQKEIAEKLEISAAYVSQIIKKNSNTVD